MRIAVGLRARLAAVQMMVFDVDGVLTEGQIIYTDEGAEAKGFDVKDGLGLRVAVGAGVVIALMTGRSSRVTERRARDLHITDVLQRVGDKVEALRHLAAEKRVPMDRIAFVGDDVNDREAMRLAGVAIAPADAVPEIRDLAQLVTEARAGRGAAREAVEAVLRAQDRWEQAVEGYLKGLSERDRARRVADGGGV
jgi:3-deoxy-D-manno-octulosonate 8-phosphate phosphatase (KDO 8-P phosphatase)